VMDPQALAELQKQVADLESRLQAMELRLGLREVPPPPPPPVYVSPLRRGAED
jgi:hypothetical protein